MTKQQICIVFVLLVLLFTLIYSLNFYFLTHLNDDLLLARERYSTPQKLEQQIRRATRNLKPQYVNKNPRFYTVRNKLLHNLSPMRYENASILWDISHYWPKNNEIYPQFDSSMGQLLKALQEETIISARNAPRGTQLKLLLNLNYKQKVIFKPKWYEREEVISGVVYSGKDRHRAELLAFYLGAVLNLRWTPIAVGRKINMKEIYEKADKDLRDTITISDDESEMCVYGKCYYCKETEAVCADSEHMLEGVVLQLIPGTLSKYRSPWQRTYKENVNADWEINMQFCEPLKTRMAQTRLLDLIDVAIFDFLIQNGDRHHFETRNERVVLVDNGKGFGNPNIDFLDILAPLYQCCILRKNTWDRLLMMSGGVLSEYIDQLSKKDPLYPILSERQFKAIDRRLLLVYGTVENCMERFGADIFE